MKPAKSNKTYKSTGQDVVMTPPETAMKILNYYQQHWSYGTKSKILEPCKGEGAFYNNMIGDKNWCEVSEGKDFMDWNEQVDWIITNPPYSIFDIFLKKAMSVSDNIVFFVPLSKLFKSKLNDLMVKEYGGIREIVNMGTGAQHGFKVGFLVGCIYYKKNYTGDIQYKRLYN